MTKSNVLIKGRATSLADFKKASKKIADRFEELYNPDVDIKINVISIEADFTDKKFKAGDVVLYTPKYSTTPEVTRVKSVEKALSFGNNTEIRLACDLIVENNTTMYTETRPDNIIKVKNIDVEYEIYI